MTDENGTNSSGKKARLSPFLPTLSVPTTQLASFIFLVLPFLSLDNIDNVDTVDIVDYSTAARTSTQMAHAS